MKGNISNVLLCSITVIFVSFFQYGCKKDNSEKTYTTTYTIMKPVYKDKSVFLSNINGSANQPIENGGKIYIKDKFIFLNEVDKGIHVIDNSDPSHPYIFTTSNNRNDISTLVTHHKQALLCTRTGKPGVVFLSKFQSVPKHIPLGFDAE